MKKYSFTEKEYNKWTKSYQDVIHSTTAESFDKACNKFYKHMKNFGWTKDEIRSKLNG